ncbi:MAG TPA: DUF4240 domain-containing protein [Longimicrobiales bacterium]|nr:DUF4240 domain-containing protein [Longimicrobiales bacterium]
MPIDPDFWALIEETRPADGDPSRHADALTERLVDRGVDDVRAFGARFHGAMGALYRWDLWGAAYLVFGGCGDDAFEYLRAWIIGRGESAWRQARTDPQAFFLSLVGDAEDVEDRLVELGVHDGEPLLYAAGTAHERLTGEWLPPPEVAGPLAPAGEEWDEEDLEECFPALAEVAPGDASDPWSAAEVVQAPPPDPVGEAVHAGLRAFSRGDHATAEAHLAPLVDDPDVWRQVYAELQVDVAYVVSAVRLQQGRVDAAAEALSRVEDRIGEVPPVRRALAQIELARHRLDRAARWIDDGPGAERMDRALAAKLAWREGRGADAVAGARRELEADVEPHEHPWDVAGALHQVGTVLAEAGDAAGAGRATRALAALLADAPEELPLLAHLELLAAAVHRLDGDHAEALARLDPLCRDLDGTDLAEALREKGRTLREMGRRAEAAAALGEAIRGFEQAGERWDAEATRREQNALE